MFMMKGKCRMMSWHGHQQWQFSEKFFLYKRWRLIIIKDSEHNGCCLSIAGVKKSQTHTQFSPNVWVVQANQAAQVRWVVCRTFSLSKSQVIPLDLSFHEGIKKSNFPRKTTVQYIADEVDSIICRKAFEPWYHKIFLDHFIKFSPSHVRVVCGDR